MREEDGKVDGNLEIEDEFTLHGMVTGDLVVRPGGLLQVNGLVTGDLVVEKGGRALLYGLVSGDAHNRGGILEIFGLIQGGLLDQSGTTTVHAGAVIRGGA